MKRVLKVLISLFVLEADFQTSEKSFLIVPHCKVWRDVPLNVYSSSVLSLLVEREIKQEQSSHQPYAPFLPKARVAPVVLGDPAK